MKIFNFLFVMLFLTTMSFAQNAPINFETGGQGASWTWTVFENDVNPAVEVVANPVSGGINTSATVAKFTALQAGQAWAGCESNKNADLGTFVLDASNSKIKIMVYKTVISDVGIKLANATGWSQGEKKVANTKINEWEELTFDFSDFINPPGAEPLSQIVVFPDFDLVGRLQDNVVYFDNITFNAATGVAMPTIAAPIPIHNAANVISMFSNAYTDVIVDTWRTDWSAATYEEVQIEGNATKKYSNLDYVGIETVANKLNVSTKTHFHLDVWSSNFTNFGVKLVDFGADGAFGGGDDSEFQVNIATPAQNEWVSLNIPLSDFTTLTGKEHIAQLILVGQPTGTATVYVDNVYFHDGTTSINNVSSNQIKVYPNPAAKGTQITINEEVNQYQILDLSGKIILQSNSTSVINTENLNAGLYILKTTTKENLIKTQKLIIK